MKTFDLDLLQPKQSFLKSKIFQNPYLKIPPTLFFDIEIQIKPFKIEGEIADTQIRLCFIKFDIGKIEELEGRSFDFPVNPEEGYIDGSLYLFNVYNPFDVTNITFGDIKDGKIEAQIEYSIDFQYEATEYFNVQEACLKAVLELDKLTIDSDVLEGTDANLNKAKELLSKFTEVNDFNAPVIHDGVIEFCYKKI